MQFQSISPEYLLWRNSFGELNSGKWV